MERPPVMKRENGTHKIKERRGEIKEGKGKEEEMGEPAPMA